MGVEMFDNKPMSNRNPRFTDWLRAQPKRTDEEWATFFGVSRPHFSMVRGGSAQPSKRLMARIEALTGGDVPILSWFAPAAKAEAEERAA